MNQRLYRNEDIYLENPDFYSESGSDTEPVNYDNLYDKDITANFRRVQNIETLLRIIRTIEVKMERQLLENERSSVRQMINNEVNVARSYRRDPTKRFYLQNLQNWNDETIITKIADRWINIMRRRDNGQPGPQIENIHAMLRKEIGTVAESSTSYSPTFIQPLPKASLRPPPGIKIDSILTAKNKYSILNLLNPNALRSNNYIYLDSRQRDLATTNGINRFVWNEDNTGNITQGNFTYLGVVRDVVQIKVMPFRIPYPSDGSADNGFKSITLLFEEFQNQSYHARNARRFHILFQVVLDGDFIFLNPYQINDGEFKFDQPITTINQLTLSFGNPTNIINFDVDRLFCTFTYGAITILSFTQDHNLINGNIISLVDFTTADPSGDAPVIAEMNAEVGHEVTIINATSFSITVDTTTITPIADLTIICVFISKTFQIPIQFTFIRPDEGAYIIGGAPRESEV